MSTCTHNSFCEAAYHNRFRITPHTWALPPESVCQTSNWSPSTIPNSWRGTVHLSVTYLHKAIAGISKSQARMSSQAPNKCSLECTNLASHDTSCPCTQEQRLPLNDSSHFYGFDSATRQFPSTYTRCLSLLQLLVQPQHVVTRFTNQLTSPTNEQT